MRKYKYPFRSSNRGVAKISSRKESRWDGLEETVVNEKVLPILKRKKKRGRLVDIGAGVGKYTNLLGRYFTDVVAIEPDSERLAETSNLFGDDKRLKAINDFVKNVELKESSADAVVSIHLLQHVDERSEKDILDKASKWLKKGGVLVLCFTIENKFLSGHYISWNDENSKVMFTKVPKEVFELVVKNRLGGTLPVRKLKVGKVIDELKKRGFKIMVEEKYVLLSSRKTIEGVYDFLTYIFPDYKVDSLLKKIGIKNVYLDCCLVAIKK